MEVKCELYTYDGHFGTFISVDPLPLVDDYIKVEGLTYLVRERFWDADWKILRLYLERRDSLCEYKK